MLDIGWMEMAIIALVALVVIGPKDLPKAMRSVAKWVRKARSLSREFQSGLDEMMRETELDEAKKSIESVRRYNVDKLVEEELDPTGSVSRELKDIDDSARDRPGSTGTGVKGAGVKGTGAKATDAKEAAKAVPAVGEAPAAEAGGTSPQGDGETAATAEAAPDPAARRGKGRVVSHPAQIAPGNSVKPPAAAATEAPAEAAPADSAVPDKASRSGGGTGG